MASSRFGTRSIAGQRPAICSKPPLPPVPIMPWPPMRILCAVTETYAPGFQPSCTIAGFTALTRIPGTTSYHGRLTTATALLDIHIVLNPPGAVVNIILTMNVILGSDPAPLNTTRSADTLNPFYLSTNQWAFVGTDTEATIRLSE